jgi:hypothetical protein
MTPIEMHYSCVGFVYAAVVWLGNLLREKWFDVLLAAAGTRLGYWWAKKHIEHFIGEDVIKKLDTRYLELNKRLAFDRAVTAMIPELPGFYLRPTRTLSTSLALALGDYTQWATAINPEHTAEQSMKLVGEAAQIQAELMIGKDMGFREAASVPSYEWVVGMDKLPVGWTMTEEPTLTIYNWETGEAVYRHARMEEKARTADSVRYSWMWDIHRVPCGLYVGVTNFTLGGTAKGQNTASSLGKRLRVFLTKEKNGQIWKSHEEVDW